MQAASGWCAVLPPSRGRSTDPARVATTARRAPRRAAPAAAEPAHVPPGVGGVAGARQLQRIGAVLSCREAVRSADPGVHLAAEARAEPAERGLPAVRGPRVDPGAVEQQPRAARAAGVLEALPVAQAAVPAAGEAPDGPVVPEAALHAGRERERRPHQRPPPPRRRGFRQYVARVGGELAAVVPVGEVVAQHLRQPEVARIELPDVEVGAAGPDRRVARAVLPHHQHGRHAPVCLCRTPAKIVVRRDSCACPSGRN